MTVINSRLGDALRDRYILERELGRGGMATVYLARDLKHDREVALKVLHPELAANVGPERFLREIRIAAQLNHPHILAVFDSGAADGFLYYTMPYVEGESLRVWLEREVQLPLEPALRIVSQVADALEHAHRKGVVHRDIKPENILIEGGEAVVADFGLALAISAAGGDRLTESGLALGTPAYMSPEQAAGEQHLDGRADVYSLGCVLYELLAGEPPFTGPTAQAVIAKRFASPVPRIRVVREGIPPAVEYALGRALAKVPADRFTSAGEFANALREPHAAPPRPPFAAIRGWGTILGLGALLAAGGILLLRNRMHPPTDSNLLAVAPFDVFEPTLQLWHEGLVDVLARNLDGAGPLRTVSPTVVLRRWRGRSDPKSAAELGRRTGAGVVVFGQVVGTSGDSVRIVASIQDVTRDATLGDAEIRGSSNVMDRLTDSLTLRLLLELGRTRPIGAARLATFGSASLAALKAFLQGEQEFRRSNWDSAIVHYQRATELDTTFTLAYNRLGAVRGWRYGERDSLYSLFMLRAGVLNHGLAPRESLMVAADSMMAALSSASLAPVGLDHLPVIRRLFRTVSEAATRYPSDPMVLLSVGEARTHYSFFIGESDTLALEPFDRAILVDSAFTPAYIHPVQLALNKGDISRALRYIDAYLALRPSGDDSEAMRLVKWLLERESGDSGELGHLIDTVSGGRLYPAYGTLWGITDSAEIVLRLVRLLAENRPDDTPLSKARLNLQLAKHLLRRGHTKEVRALIGDPQGGMKWYYLQALLLGAVPRDSAAVTFQHWLRERDGWSAMALWWWADQGDTAAVQQFVQAQDSIFQGDWTPYADYYAQAMPAYLNLARRDTARALEQFMALPDSLCLDCAYDRITSVRLLRATGRTREAADRLRAPITPTPGALDVVWALERALVNEQLGNNKEAVEDYSFVAQCWTHADPPLQAVVSQVRAALNRLRGEDKD